MQLSSQIAEVYEEFFVPALFGAWPAPVLAAAGVQTGEQLLDVACGTGILARHAVDQVGSPDQVVGLDLNEGMLEVARRKAPAVTWRQGRAEALPFADQSFDVVVSQFGLMFFDDRVRALQEMLRVLRPGGKLAIAVWDSLDHTPGYAAIVALLQQLFGAEAAKGLRAPYCLGDRQLLSALLAQAGIADATIVTHPGIARFASIEAWMYTDIKGWVLADTLDDQQYTRLLASAETELQPFVITDGSVAFAAPAHIITLTTAS